MEDTTHFFAQETFSKALNKTMNIPKITIIISKMYEINLKE